VVVVVVQFPLVGPFCSLVSFLIFGLFVQESHYYEPLLLFFPFLFRRLFSDGQCDHSVDVVFECCELVVIRVVRRPVYDDVHVCGFSVNSQFYVVGVPING